MQKEHLKFNNTKGGWLYAICSKSMGPVDVYQVSQKNIFSATDTLVRLKIDDGQLSKISGILPKIQFSTSDHENISDA